MDGQEFCILTLYINHGYRRSISEVTYTPVHFPTPRAHKITFNKRHATKIGLTATTACPVKNLSPSTRRCTPIQSAEERQKSRAPTHKTSNLRPYKTHRASRSSSTATPFVFASKTRATSLFPQIQPHRSKLPAPSIAAKSGPSLRAINTNRKDRRGDFPGSSIADLSRAPRPRRETEGPLRLEKGGEKGGEGDGPRGLENQSTDVASGLTALDPTAGGVREFIFLRAYLGRNAHRCRSAGAPFESNRAGSSGVPPHCKKRASSLDTTGHRERNEFSLLQSTALSSPPLLRAVSSRRSEADNKKH
ncbi:hypothetical protein KM043_009675 [Ampulex compressa]|nr:hypothetical protein KM043_009675 [Ampulex compressa]